MVADVREVNVREIELELRRLWREQAGDRERTDQPLLRVRTLNLIIYTPTSTREDISAMLDPLIAEHPARVIAIHGAPGERPRAWISAARIPTRHTGESIGRELISIQCGPEAHQELRSMVLPLLVHDVPVYLWWRGRPGFDMDLFQDLARAADRIIIDSDELPRPAVELQALARAVAGTTGAVSDLAWARLTPWRQLTAQFFNAPTDAEHLQRINRVILEYGGEVLARAILLAAWLASRLGWTARRLQQDPLALELGNGSGAVRVDFRKVNLSERRLTRLDLSAGAEAQFSITRLSETGCFVTVSDIQGNTLRRRVPCSNLGESALISRELDLPGRDVLYEQALRLIGAAWEE